MDRPFWERRGAKEVGNREARETVSPTLVPAQPVRGPGPLIESIL